MNNSQSCLPTLGTLAVLAMLVLSAGCRLPAAALRPSQMGYGPQKVENLALRPGDELEISFLYTPELNTLQIVRPDGTISLPLLGEITAEGRTAAELRRILQEAYSTQLKDAELTVIPRTLRNWQVYVNGEVRLPQPVLMTGQMTALEAVMAAGGINWLEAEPRNVVIIRFQDGKRLGCAIDLTDALAGKVSKPFYLQPNDIVYVPRSSIARVNQWIDQHINRIIPQFGFSVNSAGEVGVAR